jgi:hypothetical protein
MDINAALDRMRELVAKVSANADGADDDALSLAVVFDAIDGWLNKGGFLPGDWMANRNDIANLFRNQP